jgi:DNA polymerase-3 subunit delta'
VSSQASSQVSGAIAPPIAPTIAPPFDKLVGQELAARFLTAVIASGEPSQAYLFAGPLGSGKTEAANAFARALLCAHGGADDCDTCRRVLHGTHPDFHVITPGGASGYLIEQVQEVIASAALAPVRATRKVYLFTRADLLSGHAANALLKTLEETPANTVFILLARNRDAVLETIDSRCQVLVFCRIPEDEAIAAVVEKTGATPEQARIALATAGGSLFYAERFWRSRERRTLRDVTLKMLELLPHDDDASVLEAVVTLIKEMKTPLDVVRMEQERHLEQSREFLGSGALSRLEQQQRRELTSRERETIGEVLDVTRSWLRDLMAVQTPVNVDFHANIERLAQTVSLDACVRALDAVDEAQRQIQYNVNTQLAFEAMLFKIRRELR